MKKNLRLTTKYYHVGRTVLYNILSEFSYFMATRQLSRDATVDDLGDISRSLDCFTSKFSRTVRDTAKVTMDYK